MGNGEEEALGGERRNPHQHCARAEVPHDAAAMDVRHIRRRRCVIMSTSSCLVAVHQCFCSLKCSAVRCSHFISLNDTISTLLVYVHTNLSPSGVRTISATTALTSSISDTRKVIGVLWGMINVGQLTVVSRLLSLHSAPISHHFPSDRNATCHG